MSAVVYKPIGVVHSSFKVPQDVPIQSAAAEGVTGYIELSKEYMEGLRYVGGFSHLILIYHCHMAQEYSLLVRPFLDKQLHGVFSTRAPSRPNSIGTSIVRLNKIENNLLRIQDVDIIDGTPLLDIKPYVPQFDERTATKIGWLAGNIDNMRQRRDDGRFAKNSNM